MTKNTSMKNIEIILAIRNLQKIISDTESQEVIKVLKEARNALIKIYAEDEEEELKEVEQKFIETLKPTYNQINEKDLDFERKKKTNKEYQNQLCCYNGEVLTLASLSMRFRRARMPNPDIEAKKYLIGGNNE